MASIETEMPPMHAAETGGVAGGGVADNGSNNSNGNANGGNNAAAVVSSGPHSNGSGVGDAGQPGTNSNNNTISAAADSSDNQPGTPQPPTNGQLIANNEQQQQQLGHNPYAMYSSVATTTNGNVGLPHMYGSSIYATAGSQPDMQQQQQQQPPYPSYLNSFEQFYQQQQQQQQQQQHQAGAAMDYGLMYGAGGNSNGSSDYKSNQSAVSNVRYHPYLNNPTSCSTGDGNNRNGTPENNTNGVVNGGTLPLPQSSTAVSTTTNSLSPRLVSSSSPTSTSTHMQLSGSSTTGSPGGNCKLQCKKCGLMCASDNELQEHITNVHGASPYGSSGYSSSPYIKEELSSGSQQQSTATQGGNPGELLDLDSQKMVYPPAPGSIQSLLHHPHQMHEPAGGSDPLHSMHSMQQRALPGWEQPQPPNNGMQEGMPAYMQQQSTQPQPGQQQTDLSGKPPHANQSPYYSPKQSPYHVPGSMPNGATGMSIKQEYGLIKTEYPDSQNYVDKSFDPTVTADICQQPPPSVQQQQMMPVSSSPAEFPTTTTGPQDPQQQYRGFEPPSSSSVNPVSLPTKAATWKSNEARRPKTYNCTACNKWFTSSGHLKRHYNTTLHKNAVKSSGQPDPATLPISAHHHPTRDPTTTTKSHSRRNNASAAAAAAAAAAAQQQQPPAPVQPPEPPRNSPDFAQGAGMGMSQYSASPSPTQQMQMNGVPYGANPGGYQPQQQQSQYLNQVQSSTNSHSPSHINVPGISPNNSQTVLNGHPNGLAGPSAPVTPQPMPSSHTRGLLNKTTTTTTKSEPLEDNYPHNSNSNNSTMHIRSPQQETESDTDPELDNTLSSEERDRSQMDMEMLQQQQQLQLEEEAAATAAVAAEQAQEAEVQLQRHRQAQADLEQGEELQVFHHQLLEELEGPQRHYHNTTPTLNPASEHSMRPLSPLITSHQHYHQEQLQRPPGMVDNIFSPMQPPAAVTMPANIMDPQYNILPLGINTPPLLSSSMQLLPPQQPITSTSTATMVNMGSIHMLHSRHHTQQAEPEQPERLVLPSMRSMLLNNTSIQSPVDHINSITPQLLPPITTTTQQLLPPLQQQPQLHTTNTIPSFQQLQQESELAPLEPTMTYHTTIGNETAMSSEDGEVITINSSNSSNESNDYIHLSTMDPYNGMQPQQMITADGQLLQFMPSSLMGQPFFALPPHTTLRESYPRSPQEGDLPPAHTILGNGVNMQEHLYLQEPSQTMDSGAVAPYSPKTELASPDTTSKSDINTTVTNQNDESDSSTAGNNTNIIDTTTENTTANGRKNATKKVAKPRRPTKRQSASKRKISPSQCTTTPRSITLPNGRVKCLECDKEFSKNCYLTQHNKSFHSGEYPYRCVTCGKRFAEPEVHRVHNSRHQATDKPHKCDQCPKQFHHKTDLRRHIEAIHTGMKQHVCPLCNKGFCRRDHLRKHVETHSRPRVVARRVLNAIVAEGLFDMTELEKPYRPYENDTTTETKDEEQDQNNTSSGQDQCTEPKQPKAKRRKKNSNVKTEPVEMPPPLYTAPRARATSTAVSGELDENSYLISSTDESYIDEDSLIIEDHELEDENNYIIKEEPYVDGMPYAEAMPEKQLSAFF
ncbi:signal element on autosome protein 2 [Bactrocera tryoni]|uniref:signal element on autosome protein 2 n=1 Tax=Bactrocera tryoni TaxID=59916 RepID=UPI001A98EDF8|nr:signal element on autosome protein 2 [Bactrocera tryoni]